MELRELRYFQQVAAFKSFSRASVHLRIAQPALSRQVRKLEDELGVTLFVRAGRGLELTEAGMALLQRAQILLLQFSQLSEDIRSLASTVRGRVTLGVPPAAGEFLIPPLIRRCRELYPGIHLDLYEGFSGSLREKMLQRELSLCLIHNPIPHAEIDSFPMLVEHMYLVGPGPGLTELPPVDETMQLQDVPLILPRKPHSLRVLVENAVAAHGGQLKPVQQVDGLALIRALVDAGLGYTVLTYGSIHKQTLQKQLSAVLLRNPSVDWTLCINRRHEHRHAAPVNAVIEVIQSEVLRLVQEGIWRGDPQIPTPSSDAAD